jgi:hypothetical protein
MSEESPQDLDKLFQQEPEQYPFGYNEASWQEMEKLLDKDDRRRFLWWWLGGIGALILVGSIFFFGKNEMEVVDANLDFDKKEVVENRELNQNQNSETQLSQPRDSNKDDQPNSKSSDSKLSDNSNSFSNKIESNSTLNKNLQQDIYKKTKVDPSLIFGDVGFRENGIENIVLPESVLGKTDTIEEGVLLKNNHSKVEKKDFVNVLLQTDSVSLIPMLEILAKRESSVGINLLEKDTTNLQFQKRWIHIGDINQKILLLGLTVGGESSETNRNDFSKPNWKFGAQVEYRFFKKYSASVGANFIRKKYGATGDDYNPENGAWLYGVSPSTVDAVCDILEVPVSISFFQYDNSENGFYSRVGLSSFFMLEEHYWYSYDEEIPGQINYWGGENENKHWFAIGEFSIGYQHYLRPKISVQIEPFIQIPLAGIGNGKVKLWSVGLNMKLNFQVNKRIKKSHRQNN